MRWWGSYVTRWGGQSRSRMINSWRNLPANSMSTWLMRCTLLWARYQTHTFIYSLWGHLLTFLFYPYFLNRFILQMLLRATQITSSYTVLSSHILPERHSLLGITSRLHITGKRYNNNALKLIAKKINNQEDLCKKKNRIRVTDNYLPDRFNYLSECHIKTGLYLSIILKNIYNNVMFECFSFVSSSGHKSHCSTE